jgi:hypothetical protein
MKFFAGSGPRKEKAPYRGKYEAFKTAGSGERWNRLG